MPNLHQERNSKRRRSVRWSDVWDFSVMLWTDTRLRSGMWLYSLIFNYFLSTYILYDTIQHHKNIKLPEHFYLRPISSLLLALYFPSHSRHENSAGLVLHHHHSHIICCVSSKMDYNILVFEPPHLFLTGRENNLAIPFG